MRSRGLLQHNIYSPSPVLRLLHLMSSPPLDYSNTVHIWTGLSSMSSMLLEQYIAARLTNASATFPCWLVFIFSPALPLHRCGVRGLGIVRLTFCCLSLSFWMDFPSFETLVLPRLELSVHVTWGPLWFSKLMEESTFVALRKIIELFC